MYKNIQGSMVISKDGNNLMFISRRVVKQLMICPYKEIL